MILKEYFDTRIDEKSEALGSGEKWMYKIAYSNADATEGYYRKSSCDDLPYREREEARKELEEEDIRVPDSERAAALIDIMEEEYNPEHVFLKDPRYVHWIQDLDPGCGIILPPVTVKQKIIQVLTFVDDCAARLRGPLLEDEDDISSKFDDCMKWCLSSCEAWDTYGAVSYGDGIEFEEPTMDHLLDAIVSHTVDEFYRGCDSYTAEDVLFRMIQYKNSEEIYEGWDVWQVCKDESECYIPSMICNIHPCYWPYK